MGYNKKESTYSEVGVEKSTSYIDLSTFYRWARYLICEFGNDSKLHYHLHHT